MRVVTGSQTIRSYFLKASGAALLSFAFLLVGCGATAPEGEVVNSSSSSGEGGGNLGPDSANSSITANGPVIADGNSGAAVTITIRDAQGNGVSGVVPTFAATDTGSTNVMSLCSASNSSGVSTCSLSSKKAETKSLEILTPISKTGSGVQFIAGLASAAHSSIQVAPGSVTADNSSAASVTITLRDAFDNPVSGQNVTFSASGSNNNLNQPAATTDANGQAIGSMSSSMAEMKTVSLASPTLSGVDSNINFVAGSPVAANSSISASPNNGLAADGITTAAVTISLKDAFGNPCSGISSTFASSGSSNNLSQPSSMTDASGQASGTISSMVAELKTLTINSPAGLGSLNTSINFVSSNVSVANSTISGSGPVTADGSSSSTITITLRDSNNNGVSGVTPTFSATDTGATNAYGACSASSGSGVSTCSLSATYAENKTLSISTPVTKSGGSVSFTAGPVGVVYSTISAMSGIADGTTPTIVTFVLKDDYGNPVSGITPSFTVSGSGNTLTQPSVATGSSGQTTGSFVSTVGGIKSLAIVSPAGAAGVTSDVYFNGSVPANANSTITATPVASIAADGISYFDVIVTLKDANNNPVSGVTVNFGASGFGNTIAQPSSNTDTSGVAVGSIRSTVAEVKTLSIALPTGFTSTYNVTFIPAVVSVANSSIVGSGPIAADGTSFSTVTIVLKDANSQPLAGITPNFSATNTNLANIYGPCSTSDSLGISTCTLASTKPEAKNLSITSPVTKTGGTVTFYSAMKLQVPIELLDSGIVSGASIITFERSRTTLNTNDYDGIVSYFFEAVCTNSDSMSRTLNLIDSSGTNRASLSIDAATSAPTRFHMNFTPVGGASNYRVQTSAGSVGAMTCHTARILVTQTEATKTKIYIPLVGDRYNEADSNNNVSATNVSNVDVTSSTSYTQATTNHYSIWRYDAAQWATLDPTTPFTMEAVLVSFNGTPRLALFNKTTGNQVTGSEVVGSSSIGVYTKSFTSSAANFTSGNDFEVRIRRQGGNGSNRTILLKAGIWVKLSDLKTARVPFRLSRYFSASTGMVNPNQRVEIDLGHFKSTSSASFEVVGSEPTVGSSDLTLISAGADEAAADGSPIMGSNINFGVSAKSRINSGILSLTNGDRYMPKANVTSGVLDTTSAFVLIEVQ
jgi:adhesin/invasin